MGLLHRHSVPTHPVEDCVCHAMLSTLGSCSAGHRPTLLGLLPKSSSAHPGCCCSHTAHSTLSMVAHEPVCASVGSCSTLQEHPSLCRNRGCRLELSTAWWAILCRVGLSPLFALSLQLPAVCCMPAAAQHRGPSGPRCLQGEP